MNTDNTSQDSHNTDPGQKAEEGDSFFEGLKETGQAWLSAGGRLGDVVSEFTTRFRDSDEQSQPPGAHAKHDPVSEEKSTGARFRAASRAATERLNQARSADDLKAATSGFAGHAEDIIRDATGNLRRAAAETRGGESAEEARSAFSTAIGSVRDSFDEAVAAVQARRRELGQNSGGEEESTLVADLRARLDDLINRAGSITRGETLGDQAADGDNMPDPDIIDGEVISEDTESNTSSETSDPTEKDN